MVARPAQTATSSTPAPAAADPVVGRLSTDHGTAAGGTSLTIAGKNLNQVTNVTVDRTRIPCRSLPASMSQMTSVEQVFRSYMNTAPAKLQAQLKSLAHTGACFATPTRLLMLMPPHAPGTVPVVVNGMLTKFTYAPASAPVIYAITPHQMTAAGAGDVSIIGSGFTGATGASFGGVALQNPILFIFDDANLTILQVPGGVAGSTVDIQITTPLGTSPTTSADRLTYTVPPTPAVTGILSNSGPASGGNQISIFGTGFLGAADVAFARNSVHLFEPNTSDDTLGVTVPAGTIGTVDVTVTTAGKTSLIVSVDHYTYFATPVPTITDLAPSSGASNAVVYITGTGFFGTTAVSFGSTAAASFSTFGDTMIQALTPAGSGSVPVTVTTPGGSVTSVGTFTYTGSPPPATPVVDGLSVHTGSSLGGTSITIFGTGFTNLVSVQFGQTQATLQPFCIFTCDTLIDLTTPAGAVGNTVHVTVTTNAGTSTATSRDTFTYQAPGPPSVIHVHPTQGYANATTQVQIYGANLGGYTAVHFGTLSAGLLYAPPMFQSDSFAYAWAPLGGVGTVDLTVTTPTATSAVVAADQFTYLPEPPLAVTTLGPDRGPSAGGSTVYIEGAGMSGVTGVTFGGVAATSFTAIDDDLISAVSPAGLGQVDVRFTTPQGVSPAGPGDVFSYLSAPFAPQAVSAVAGPAGSGTAVVTWSAPTYDGGSAITSYTIHCVPYCPSVNFTGTTLSVTISGLDGVYAFYTTATNQYGTGPPSPLSARITVRGPIQQAPGPTAPSREAAAPSSPAPQPTPR